MVIQSFYPMHQNDESHYNMQQAIGFPFMTGVWFFHF